MSTDPPLPLPEIHGLERAFSLGVASLGVAHRALERRHACGLDDADTVLRLIYLSWFARIESTWTTGLASDVTSAETWIARAGGIDRLPGESRFVVAWLAARAPSAIGRETDWSARAAALFESAAGSCPRSLLLGIWRWFLGEREHEQRVFLQRQEIRAELVARFSGRGLLSTHFMRDVSASLELAVRRPGLV